MRLRPEDSQIIRAAAQRRFGPDCEVMLFGSRTDDHARGGDIDLLVRPKHSMEDLYARKFALMADLKMSLGDQRIDLVVVNPQAPQSEFIKAAMAVALTL